MERDDEEKRTRAYGEPTRIFTRRDNGNNIVRFAEHSVLNPHSILFKERLIDTN